VVKANSAFSSIRTWVGAITVLVTFNIRVMVWWMGITTRVMIYGCGKGCFKKISRVEFQVQGLNSFN
jgi:hypothetical protein